MSTKDAVRIVISHRPGVPSGNSLPTPRALRADVGPRGCEASALAGYLNRTVLLVDDDPWDLQMMGDALRRDGYGVLETICGREAIEPFRSAPDVDMLVSDVALPELNGCEIARAMLKEEPDFRTMRQARKLHAWARETGRQADAPSVRTVSCGCAHIRTIASGRGILARDFTGS